MHTLVVVDAQNEFSSHGLRPASGHADALEAIALRVEEARREGRPIAWIRHHNRPDEPSAFRPGTWGAEYSPGLGPVERGDAERGDAEREFIKDVYGAFTGTDLEAWLRELGSEEVLLVGFFAHMCVSTTAREGLMRGLAVAVDPAGVASHDLDHPHLGPLTADEVRRSALLHLADMGAQIRPQEAGVTT
jgi:nicotinamidase-related amidase